MSYIRSTSQQKRSDVNSFNIGNKVGVNSSQSKDYQINNNSNSKWQQQQTFERITYQHKTSTNFNHRQYKPKQDSPISGNLIKHPFQRESLNIPSNTQVNKMISLTPAAPLLQSKQQIEQKLFHISTKTGNNIIKTTLTAATTNKQNETSQLQIHQQLIQQQQQTRKEQEKQAQFNVKSDRSVDNRINSNNILQPKNQNLSQNTTSSQPQTNYSFNSANQNNYLNRLPQTQQQQCQSSQSKSIISNTTNISNNIKQTTFEHPNRQLELQKKQQEQELLKQQQQQELNQQEKEKKQKQLQQQQSSLYKDTPIYEIISKQPSSLQQKQQEQSSSIREQQQPQSYAVETSSFSRSQQYQVKNNIDSNEQSSKVQISSKGIQEIQTPPILSTVKSTQKLEFNKESYYNKIQNIEKPVVEKSSAYGIEKKEQQAVEKAVQEVQSFTLTKNHEKGSGQNDEWKRLGFSFSKRSAAGLKNIGNTCFMNSALQCLLNTPIFNEYFFSGEYEKILKRSNKGVASNYASLIKQVRSTGTSMPQGTQYLKSSIERVAPIFRGYDQQDAQELLRTLLDGLHEDLNRVTSKQPYRELQADITKQQLQQISEEWWQYYRDRDNSPVTDFFNGQLLNCVICSKCHTKSIAFDIFMDLSLSFGSSKNDYDQSTSLEELLRLFLKEEELGDTYYCSKCKKNQQSMRQFELFKLPKILVIHLKRFNFSPGFRCKINTSVSFPLTFDIRNFIQSSHDQSIQNSQYQLFGVVHHSGSLSGGHYTAESYNPYEGQWYNFNDSMASEINSSQAQRSRSSPYLLFYCKNELLEPYKKNQY